jgi:hypothetical protein
MKYVTPATEAGMRVPPGATHKQEYMEYRPTPGIFWRCVNEETGEWVTVDRPDVKGLTSTWCIASITGRAAVTFEDKDGVRWAQPLEDDPRAKDRETGSTKKRSRFMSALKKARAEEAARQGKSVDEESGAVRSTSPRVRKIKPPKPPKPPKPLLF